jgi:tRNA pseudouridine55 synthase
MFGILLIDKPAGITSHTVIAQLRRKFNTKRVGHAGTLDPVATGLLVVAVGPATRFLQYLNLEPKTYVAKVEFGRATTTYDTEGETTTSAPIPPDLEQRIIDALPQFTGRIKQIPPIYSAIKHQGKPLYAYARKGEEITAKPRHIFVESFETLALDQPFGDFKIVCSGGTYIRSLAHDLGNAVQTGGHINQLRRTGAGSFTIDQAVPLDEASPKHLIPLSIALQHMTVATLSDSQANTIRQGQAIQFNPPITGPKGLLVNDQGNVIGIARVTETNTLQPECIIPAEVFDQLVEPA